MYYIMKCVPLASNDHTTPLVDRIYYGAARGRDAALSMLFYDTLTFTQGVYLEKRALMCVYGCRSGVVASFAWASLMQNFGSPKGSITLLKPDELWRQRLDKISIFNADVGLVSTTEIIHHDMGTGYALSEYLR